MKPFAWIVAACVAVSAWWSVARGQDRQWGTVTGRIAWVGDVPAASFHDVTNHPDGPAIIKANGGPLRDQTWVVDAKNKGLRDTFVWLEPAQDGAKIPVHPVLQKPPTDKVVMDRPGGVYAPRVIALRESQILVFKNSLPLPHNPKWTGDPIMNPGGNILLRPGGSFDVRDLKADRAPIKIESNCCPWMEGWVRVFDHPYFAVTDADGAFTIKDAPAGEWRLKIWHASGGWAGGNKEGRPVVVKAGENQIADIDYFVWGTVKGRIVAWPPVRDAFVWIEPASTFVKLPVHPALRKPTATTVELAMRGGQFEPRALAAREGQTLVLNNASPNHHNPRWAGGPFSTPNNILLPSGMKKEVAVLRGDKRAIWVECGIRPWMTSTIRVFEHPYFAVTDAHGRFVLKDAPAGNWRLKIWHGEDGWSGGAKGKEGRPIGVKIGENNLGDLQFEAPPSK